MCAAMTSISAGLSVLRYAGIFPLPSAVTFAIASALVADWYAGSLKFRDPFACGFATPSFPWQIAHFWS
jgi:hypothetical protein